MLFQIIDNLNTFYSNVIMNFVILEYNLWNYLKNEILSCKNT